MTDEHWQCRKHKKREDWECNACHVAEVFNEQKVKTKHIESIEWVKENV